MITPLSRSPSCMAGKYIGTDFDKVSNVADNMDAVKNVNTNIDVVKNVSTNMGAVVDVSNNKENINSLHEDMDTIKKVADALDTYQVMEQFALSATQVDIVLYKIDARAAALSVMGQMVDGESLTVNDDYTVTSASTIRLARTYPAGTIIRAVQVVYKNTDNPIVVVDGLGAFNRKIVTNKLGESLGPYEQEGRTVYPRLLVKGIPYVKVDEIEADTFITSETTSEPVNGIITVTTSKGYKQYTSIEAEAVSRGDIRDISFSIDGETKTLLEWIKFLRGNK